MPQNTGHPSEMRWADPDHCASDDAREIVLALCNLTEQVMRLADKHGTEEA
jgi:hypothetical protein